MTAAASVRVAKNEEDFDMAITRNDTLSGSDRTDLFQSGKRQYFRVEHSVLIFALHGITAEALSPAAVSLSPAST
jgi:hypothetical protein